MNFFNAYFDLIHAKVLFTHTRLLGATALVNSVKNTVVADLTNCLIDVVYN